MTAGAAQGPYDDLSALPSLTALCALVASGRMAILSGAGISTSSGIPDYRGPTGAARPATPMTFQVFTGSPQARQRYWARSHLGWRFISRATPNDGHRAVAALQASGQINGVITQNVDGLHQAAGAQDVIELHGALSRVACLSCAELTTRVSLDARLREVNPDWARGDVVVNPDGDVELDDVAGFVVVDCLACGGVLKPDVVFFGETVPRTRVDASYALVDQSSGLVVLGSSLQVMSGYRFVLHASKRGLPIAIVNQGPTRADHLADVRVDAGLDEVLTLLAQNFVNV